MPVSDGAFPIAVCRMFTFVATYLERQSFNRCSAAAHEAGFDLHNAHLWWVQRHYQDNERCLAQKTIWQQCSKRKERWSGTRYGLINRTYLTKKIYLGKCYGVEAKINANGVPRNCVCAEIAGHRGCADQSLNNAYESHLTNDLACWWWAVQKTTARAVSGDADLGNRSRWDYASTMAEPDMRENLQRQHGPSICIASSGLSRLHPDAPFELVLHRELSRWSAMMMKPAIPKMGILRCTMASKRLIVLIIVKYYNKYNQTLLWKWKAED